MIKFIYGLFFLFCSTSAELFTAIVDLEQLVETEGILIKSVLSYIQEQENKISLLQKYVHEYISQHEIAAKNPQTYVSNPINSYLLLKRLVSDWNVIKNLSDSNPGIEILNDFLKSNKMPTNEDLSGAAVALTRLQKTYKLDTKNLADGKINNVEYSMKLNAHDCFEIGKQIFQNEDYYYSLLWMQEADRRLGNSENEVIKRQQLLDYMSYAVYELGNIPLALKMTTEWVKIEPENTDAIEYKTIYEEICAQNNITNNTGHVYLDLSTFLTKEKPKENDYVILYQKLCRKELTLSDIVQAKLKCYYEAYNDPFLTIAPFKVEEAFKDPKVVIFHEILSNEEIETIKKVALPKFARAGVRHGNTGEGVYTGSRISKLSWLRNNEHQYIERISRRVGHMTQLDQRAAENLQVLNYGIGGHYESHYDFSRKGQDAFSNLGMGNRIATVLFYMSDVQQGGATAFTNINTAVWPKKGTAVFWFNLFPNGEGNALTKHAACPVLVGSKWVCNKWIHEYHQEFRKPCDLKATVSKYIV